MRMIFLVVGLLLATLSAAASADFPVVCGGVDDTAAFQAQVTAALPSGGRVLLPTGKCAIKGATVIPSALTIEGYGAPAWNPWPATGRGSVVVATADFLRIVSDEAVHLKNFQIDYPTRVTGSVGVSVDGPVGSANLAFSMDGVFIVGADTCLKVISATSFDVGHSAFIGCYTYSASLADVTYPGSGDSDFHDNTLSGAPTGAHIGVFSGGGLRIANNKLNQPGTGVAIHIKPNLVSTEGIAPLMIVGNSIEGTSNGILFTRNPTHSLKVGSVVIASNEIVCTAICIWSHGSGPSKWIIGVVIAANLIFPANGGVGIAMDGVEGLTIDGNQFSTAGAATALWPLMSTYSSYVTIGANGKGPGVS